MDFNYFLTTRQTTPADHHGREIENRSEDRLVGKQAAYFRINKV